MRIQANYNDIRNTGTSLQRQSARYEELLTSMMSRMNQIQSVWQGSDSQAFLGQLESLRPRMMQLRHAMDSYASLLIADAQAYEQLQANRTAGARLL